MFRNVKTSTHWTTQSLTKVKCKATRRVKIRFFFLFVSRICFSMKQSFILTFRVERKSCTNFWFQQNSYYSRDWKFEFYSYNLLKVFYSYNLWLVSAFVANFWQPVVHKSCIQISIRKQKSNLSKFILSARLTHNL